MFASFRTALAAGLLLAIAAGGRAQEAQPERPAAAHRLVARFDFEERETNPFPLPRHWRTDQDRPAALRAGFPAWNQPALDYTIAHSGEGSVRLPTRGGSTSLVLDPGVIPVFTGVDYLISAHARTRDLRHAAVLVVARFLDSASVPIPGARASSPPLFSVGGESDWVPLEFTLHGDHPDAAFLQVELLLLQPEHLPEAPGTHLPSRHRVWRQDLDGAAWFDDILVSQLPRIGFSSSSPINIISAPDRPSLELSIRDLTGEQLLAIMRIEDRHARPVDQAERRILGHEPSWRWQPRLERFGWYRATIALLNDEGTVDIQTLDLVWLPDAPRAWSGRSRLGLELQTCPAGLAAHASELVLAAAPDGVVIPAWESSATRAGMHALTHRHMPFIQSLVEHLDITFAIASVPHEALPKLPGIGEHDAAAFLAQPPEVWDGYLAPLLSRFAERVPRWRIGGPASPPDLAAAEAAAARLRPALDKLVPGLVLSALVSEEPRDAPEASTLDSMTFRTGEIEPDDPSFAAAPDLAVLLTPDQADAALVPTVVRLLARFDRSPSGRVRIDLPQPWEWVGDRSLTPMPAPAFAEWRNLADRLRGRRVIGPLAIARGLECYILAPIQGGPGALVVWPVDDSAPSAIDVVLGAGPVEALDCSGNRAAMQRSGGAFPATSWRLAIADDPVFFENIDVNLVTFVASLGLQPPFMEAGPGRHEHSILLTNPWETRLDGTLAIVEPGGGADAARGLTWSITPRLTTFSIPANETLELPVSFVIGPAEEAGTKRLVLQVDIPTHAPGGALRLATPFELGLEHIQLDLSGWTRGDDFIVQAKATNRGPDPVTLELVAIAHDQPRRKASISQLEPGETAVRNFAMPIAPLRGTRIAIGVQDVDSKARLNRSIPVE